ncbi:glycosyltransferase [Paenibacillus sp. FSL L8-0340]|uniref:glycosyltransferase family 32 protein n=1 Tax=Paenibacillus sp. FSL L8-0340 TaxID=2954685 RepID=UPI0031580C33
MDRIPKVLHYCWFGRGEMPELAKKCIESWKKILPDYEIKMWNEDNFDINSNIYVKEAYTARKYAFVTDYVRLYALFNEGGIYMDTDVEIIKPLEEFLEHEAFTGFQTVNDFPTGLIAAKPGNHWIRENLLVYKDKKFIKNDGSYDMIANVFTITNISKKMGFKEGNYFQVIANGVAIYPIEYFCAKDYITNKLCITENTYAIHHFAGSWLPTKEKIKLKLRGIVGATMYEKIKKVLLKK